MIYVDVSYFTIKYIKAFANLMELLNLHSNF
nr:MAG TPA: hypothetical protein [Crassvirales sp.]